MQRQHTTCTGGQAANSRRAPCNMQSATCTTHQAPRGMQHEQYIACNSQHATVQLWCMPEQSALCCGRVRLVNMCGKSGNAQRPTREGGGAVRAASTAGSAAPRGTAAKDRQSQSMLAGACRVRTAYASDRGGSAPETGIVGWYAVRRGSGPSCAAWLLRVCKPAAPGLGISAGERAALGTALSRLRRAALSCMSLLAVSFDSCNSHARVSARASHAASKFAC